MDSSGAVGASGSRWLCRRLGGPGGGAGDAPGGCRPGRPRPLHVPPRPPVPARASAPRRSPSRARVSDQARRGQPLPRSLAAASRGPEGASEQDGGREVREARAAATAAPVSGPGARAAPGRGPASGRTMLRSTGFFRAIDCPYWAGAPGGPCRRPYCHFRHRGARGPGALVGGGAAPPAAGNARAGLGSPAQPRLCRRRCPGARFSAQAALRTPVGVGSRAGPGPGTTHPRAGCTARDVGEPPLRGAVGGPWAPASPRVRAPPAPGACGGAGLWPRCSPPPRLRERPLLSPVVPLGGSWEPLLRVRRDRTGST